MSVDSNHVVTAILWEFPRFHKIRGGLLGSPCIRAHTYNYQALFHLYVNFNPEICVDILDYLNFFKYGFPKKTLLIFDDVNYPSYFFTGWLKSHGDI